MPPTPPTQKQTSGAERRGWVRYPASLDSVGQPLGKRQDTSLSVRVRDISVAGVGLVLSHEVPSGSTLTVRLETATQGWRSFLVRVKRCHPMGDGHFHVGCAFVRPLKDAEFRSLLQ